MKIKNNYNECLTNVACSIRKYFDLDYKHNTLKYLDDMLEQKQPKNVVLILLDGMGSNILDNTLDENSFFRKNKYKNITSVFPATTTAATTSIRTGLNPIEHGWLGWNMYISSIDKIVTLYMNKEKGTNKYVNTNDFLSFKSISDEINDNKKYNSIELFPFPTGNTTTYSSLDEMINMIIKETSKEGKRFIYAYNDEPDHTMHEKGPYAKEVKELIEERNNKLEELSNELDNTLLIILADHGHIKVDNIFLKDYPEIYNMLERNTSSEQRAVSFKIKKEYINEFPKVFNKYFGKWFNLYTKKEIIESKIYGDGKEHELFNEALGDFIAIAENSNKTINLPGDDILVSQHAGYTDDEVYIPLIIISK